MLMICLVTTEHVDVAVACRCVRHSRMLRLVEMQVVLLNSAEEACSCRRTRRTIDSQWTCTLHSSASLCDFGQDMGDARANDCVGVLPSVVLTRGRDATSAASSAKSRFGYVIVFAAERGGWSTMQRSQQPNHEVRPIRRWCISSRAGDSQAMCGQRSVMWQLGCGQRLGKVTSGTQ